MVCIDKMFADAVLLIDKKPGMTSYDIVRKVKRIIRVRKIGHSGTLDRFASGLLVLCTGRATKLTTHFLDSDKGYTGTVRLGILTDTDDIEGAVVKRRSTEGLDRDMIISAADMFKGEIDQLPPLYSALKINGQRASDRVRRGEQVELKKRRVRVSSIRVHDIDTAGAVFKMDVECSKGTYIRSIARDMGEHLGTGACLEQLRRTRSGNFSVKDAVTVEELEVYCNTGNSEKNFIVRPVDSLRDCTAFVVDDEACARIKNGGFFSRESVLKHYAGNEKKCIILDKEENIIAIADIDIDKWHIKYFNVFADGL